MSTEIKREWLEVDYYAALGVAESASQEEITKAYRKLARQWHPDANAGDDAAGERFKEISAAYDVIGDAATRKQYDQVRRMGPLGGGFGGTGGPGGGFEFNVDDLGDLSGLFGSMFGGRGGSPFGANPRQPRAMRGRDQEASLSIGFDEAVQGITTSLTLTDQAGPRTMKVRIPAGVESGQKIRLRGKGGAGTPPGDLLVTVTVADHPLYGRDGDRLTLEVPVTFAEATLGADIDVPRYGGGSVTVRIPAGSQSGRTMRVRGAGAETETGRGDLLVTLRIAVPKNLSSREKEALEQYASLNEESPRSHLWMGDDAR